MYHRLMDPCLIRAFTQSVDNDAPEIKIYLPDNWYTLNTHHNLTQSQSEVKEI